MYAKPVKQRKSRPSLAIERPLSESWSLIMLWSSSVVRAEAAFRSSEIRSWESGLRSAQSFETPHSKTDFKKRTVLVA